MFIRTLGITLTLFLLSSIYAAGQIPSGKKSAQIKSFYNGMDFGGLPAPDLIIIEGQNQAGALATFYSAGNMFRGQVLPHPTMVVYTGNFSYPGELAVGLLHEAMHYEAEVQTPETLQDKWNRAREDVLAKFDFSGMPSDIKEIMVTSLVIALKGFEEHEYIDQRIMDLLSTISDYNHARQIAELNLNYHKNEFEHFLANGETQAIEGNTYSAKPKSGQPGSRHEDISAVGGREAPDSSQMFDLDKNPIDDPSKPCIDMGELGGPLSGQWQIEFGSYSDLNQPYEIRSKEQAQILTGRTWTACIEQLAKIAGMENLDTLVGVGDLWINQFPNEDGGLERFPFFLKEKGDKIEGKATDFGRAVEARKHGIGVGIIHYTLTIKFSADCSSASGSMIIAYTLLGDKEYPFGTCSVNLSRVR